MKTSNLKEIVAVGIIAMVLFTVMGDVFAGVIL